MIARKDKRMKILIVNKFLFPNGGSETYIFEIGKQLQKMGNEVQYFGMEHEGRIVGNHAESYTADMDFHGGGLQKLLYPFKIIYSMEARKKIRLVLDDMQPDVVHLNNINFQITPSVIDEVRAWEKRNGHPVKIIFTAHDYQWVCPNHMLMIPSNKELCFQCRGGRFGSCTKNCCIHGSKLKSLLGTMEALVYQKRKTYSKVDCIICPSAFMKEKISTNPLLSDKLVVMHNFLTDEKNQQASVGHVCADKKERQDSVGDVHADEKDQQVPVGDFCKDTHTTNSGDTDYRAETNDYVLYFGRYSEEKGIGTLLRVCSKLPEIPFVFAGGGPLENKLSVYENITNAGFLHGEQLRQTVEKAKFVVFPSEWYENCPFTVMESQWYGTPVIASRIGGVPELVEDGQTGELFEAGNAEELKEKIVSLWNDAARLHRYTENCGNVQFDAVEAYCEKLLKLYG